LDWRPRGRGVAIGHATLAPFGVALSQADILDR